MQSEWWVVLNGFHLSVIPPFCEVSGGCVVGLDGGWGVPVQSKCLDLVKGSGVQGWGEGFAV